MVNRIGPKDYLTSVQQRIDMLQFEINKAGYGDRVEIVAQPWGGTPAFLTHLRDKLEKPILAFYGSDAFTAGVTPEMGIEGVKPVVIGRAGNDLESTKNTHRVPELERGNSSTSAREDMQSGRPSPQLDPELQSYASKRRFYISPESMLPHETEEAYREAYAEYCSVLAKQFTRKARPLSGPPPFKPGQTREAWFDKFLRHTHQTEALTAVEMENLSRQFSSPLSEAPRTSTHRASIDRRAHRFGVDCPVGQMRKRSSAEFDRSQLPFQSP
jgi:hypothetical protein